MGVFVTPSFAIGIIESGDTIPTIALFDQHGKERHLDDLSGEQGAVLVFVRSVDWCPYCQAQLINLGNEKDKFAKAGYNFVGISYDSIKKLKKFDDKKSIGFALLSDKNSKLIKEFGIFDDSHKEGSFAYGVPKPTIYVINKKGVVQAFFSEESYKKRPQVDAIMDAINAVQ